MGSNLVQPGKPPKLARIVQISLDDADYADRLRRCLLADPSFADCRILCGHGEQLPEGGGDRVCVTDAAHLPLGSASPGKTVLIASGAVDLSKIWEAGIVSVLRHSEPIEYIKLAILAALLRPAKPPLSRSAQK